MKRTIILCALAIALTLLLSVALHSEDKHVCADPLHYTCDGLCECDGMECSN